MNQAWLYDVPERRAIDRFPPVNSRELGVVEGDFEEIGDIPVELLDEIEPEGFLAVVICDGRNWSGVVI